MNGNLNNAKTIWVDKVKHPEFQKSFETTGMSRDNTYYRVAEFKKLFKCATSFL